MKKFLLSLIICVNILPQAEYVRIDNRIYEFLERMYNLQIISNYDKFEIPKTRGEIADFLQQVISASNRLDDVDKNMLEDYKIEFEHELYGSLKNSESIIGNYNYDLLSQNEKYLYYFEDKQKMTLFINLVVDGEIIGYKDHLSNKSGLAELVNVGGELRGTVLNKIGFYMRGTNGIASGDKSAALLRKELKYNFKFNEKPEEKFFDETQAYVNADFDLVKLKLGRDRVKLGYGNIKSILDENSPMFDYLSFRIDYDFFNFSYIHGKLLGEKTIIPDTITGEYNFVEEKYFVYHRIGFDLSKHINFGIGEVAVYGDRPFDLSYFVPFNFFKSVEHSNRDRDNTMLFMDFSNRSITNTNIFFTFLIDDISFDKIGSGWWGNQTMYNFGIHSSPFYQLLPLDIKFEYLRLEPYTFSHRLLKNSYTNLGYNLESFLQPNSELFFFGISYRFTNRLSAAADFSYSNHGSNILNSDGTITNVGGDINLGHREFDSETTKFLNGNLEIFRNFSAKIHYEPYNQLSLFLNAMYILNSAKGQKQFDETQIYFGTNLKF